LGEDDVGYSVPGDKRGAAARARRAGAGPPRHRLGPDPAHRTGDGTCPPADRGSARRRAGDRVGSGFVSVRDGGGKSDGIPNGSVTMWRRASQLAFFRQSEEGKLGSSPPRGKDDMDYWWLIPLAIVLVVAAYFGWRRMRAFGREVAVE